jgi:hypothetical protein
MSNDKRFHTLSQILANDERFHELMPEGQGPAPGRIQQFHRDVDHLRTRLQNELTNPPLPWNPMQDLAMTCIMAGSSWWDDHRRTSSTQLGIVSDRITSGYVNWRLANDDAFWTEIHKWVDTLDTLH